MTRDFLTIVVLAVLAGCSGDSTTAPAGEGPDPAPAPAPAPAPTTAAVSVGSNLFRSGHNGTTNPAVDTVAVGGTVTWTWANTGDIPHSVRSLGSPAFTSSAIQTGDGSSHAVAFTAPGAYEYDCAVHGAMMTGRIVVR